MIKMAGRNAQQAVRAATGAALVAALALAGCASIQPPVTRTSAMEPDAAYVAGIFSQEKTHGFAFTLKNLGTGQEYNMSLGDDSFAWGGKTTREEVAAIKVPPGRYQVTQWMTYSAFIANERTSRSDIPAASPLATPFELQAGEVRLLGKFTTTSGSNGRRIFWRIQPQPLTTAKAKSAFHEAYASFNERAFYCTLCVDLDKL